MEESRLLGLDLDDCDRDHGRGLSHGYPLDSVLSARPLDHSTVNDHTSDPGQVDSVVLHLLLKQASIRPPLGWNLSANRDRRSHIEAIVSIPGVGGGPDVTWRTKDGGGTSDSTGASCPLWNQDMSIRVQKGSTVSVIVAEYWREADNNQDRKRVCGTATFVAPGDHCRGENGTRVNKYATGYPCVVYEGWLSLKNEHGGSEGKISVAMSTEAEHIENMKMGLAPVTSSGFLMPISEIPCMSVEELARRRSTDQNFSPITDTWGLDLEKLSKSSPIPRFLKDESYSSSVGSTTSGSSADRANKKHEAVSADWQAINSAKDSRHPYSDTFALDRETNTDRLCRASIGLTGQTPLWI